VRSGEQDAMMLDVGEKGRPPGDPPDKLESWATKVKGSAGGGILKPEDVIDDEFVRERVGLEFPDGEDEEPVITIGEEVLEAMNGLWKKCMIVKVLGSQIPISVLNRKLRELWKPSGVMTVMDLPRQFFMIRFELEEEYMAALTGGPWRVLGNYLLVQDWSSRFDPLRDDIVTTPVWVRLSNIPYNYYHRCLLMEIARGLGRPLKVDMNTINFDKGRFARVCIEVNLAKPLKGTVLINGDRYFVAYEGLSKICSSCGIYGHLVHSCPRNVVVKVSAGAETVTDRAVVPVGMEGDDGFTVVQRTARRPAAPVQKMVFAVGASGGRSKQRLRELPKNQGVDLANRFGGLDGNGDLPDLREVAITEGPNKENEYHGRNVGKVMGVPLVKEARGSTQMEKGKGGSKGGFKWKRNGGMKALEPIGPKQKHGAANKPARGLIFGPTKDANSVPVGEDLLSNGKRLRVEQRDVGRPGGVYSSAMGSHAHEASFDLDSSSTLSQRFQREDLMSEIAVVSHEGSEVGNSSEGMA